MTNMPDHALADTTRPRDAAENAVHVEVVEGSLWSSSELSRAVMTGAVLSGIICSVVGAGIGYLIGFRDGREW